MGQHYVFIVLSLYSSKQDLKWNNDYGVKVRLSALRCLRVFILGKQCRAQPFVYSAQRPKCSKKMIQKHADKEGMFLTGKISHLMSNRLNVYFICWKPERRQRAAEIRRKGRWLQYSPAENHQERHRVPADVCES